MGGDLHKMFSAAAGPETQRFETEHRGDESMLYLRAIGPRRASRRLLVALPVAMLLAFACAALLEWTRPSAAADRDDGPVVPSAGSFEYAWVLPGGYMIESEHADSLSAVFGTRILAWEGCDLLDEVSRLGPDRASVRAAMPMGSFVSPDGAANEVSLRSFGSPAIADRYQERAMAAAERCGKAAQGAGFEVAVVTAAVVATPGTGVRIDVRRSDSDRDSWGLRIHRVDGDLIAVVVEPGAQDRSAELIRGWARFRSPTCCFARG